MQDARTLRRALALALGLAIVLLVAGVAVPADARPSPGPMVDVQPAVWVAPDGGSITVQVLASCPERWTVVEAVVAVSQPQASGQATFPLTCIGALRMFTVVVPSEGGTFELGEAVATGAVTIKRGKTQRTQESEVVQVQPAVLVDLGGTATTQSGGGALLLDLVVACPVGATGHESFVGVTQDQTASGTGAYVPVCDGRQHTFSVLVEATQGEYRVGDARALTFAIVEHGGFGFSGVDDGPVQIVAGP